MQMWSQILFLFSTIRIETPNRTRSTLGEGWHLGPFKDFSVVFCIVLFCYGINLVDPPSCVAMRFTKTVTCTNHGDVDTVRKVGRYRSESDVLKIFRPESFTVISPKILACSPPCSLRFVAENHYLGFGVAYQPLLNEYYSYSDACIWTTL